MRSLLFLCAFAALASIASSQQMSGCFMQNSDGSAGLSRTFPLNIAENEVFLVLTLDLSDWDNVTVGIRNVQHNSIDFKLRPYRKGSNMLETWLVKGSYEVTLMSVNNFAAASLCYRYSAATRQMCKDRNMYSVSNYASFVQCGISVPAGSTHQLIKLSFKYAAAYVGVDRSDVSTSSYDYMSLTSPLYVTLAPSQSDRMIYLVIAAEAAPGLSLYFDYSVIPQEYSQVLWLGAAGALNEQVKFDFTIPQPGALTSVILTSKFGDDLDLFINRVNGPDDVNLYEYRSDISAGQQDMVQVWLPGGSYTAGVLGFSAFTGGSLYYSYSKPSDVPHCKQKDSLFGELYYPFFKCKVEVDSRLSEQVLSVEFNNDVRIYASEGDSSVSQSNYHYATSASPLLISVPKNSNKKTYYVQLQTMRIIRNVNFGYRVEKRSVTDSCFFQGLGGPAGSGSQTYQFTVPYDTSRVVLTANPGSGSKFTVQISSITAASGSGSMTVVPFTTTSTAAGKLAVIDTWLPRGTYEVSYMSDTVFIAASICVQIFDHPIPECKDDMIAALYSSEYYQCKLNVGSSTLEKLLEVVVAPRRIVGGVPTPLAVQREIYINVDHPVSPKGSYQFSNMGDNSGSTGRSPFVRIKLPKGESHSYYVLFLADTRANDYSATIFSSTVRSQFITAALQSYSIVDPMPSPNGCGHSQIWNDGELLSMPLGIVGGMTARKREFPWQVSLSMNGGAQYCSGTILNKRWIITTGRCCQGYNQFDIRLGSDGNFMDSSSGQVIQPEKVVLHPFFARRSIYSPSFDFCLLRLSMNIDLSSWLNRPICLPESCEQTCQADDRVVLSGYGYTAKEQTFASKMQKIVVPVKKTLETTDEAVLNSASDQVFSYSFTRSEAIPIGRIEGGIDACTGDYGSPVACFKRGAFYLDGIYAFGDTCGSPHANSGAAKVCEVLPWIHSNIDADQ